jgi:hypothetical protein
MAQHFLLSAVARSLSAAKIMLISDREVEEVFLRLRWPETGGKPVCPGCGCEFVMPAFDHMGHRDGAARLAERTSRSHLARCSPGTSCHCEFTCWRPSSFVTR